LPVNQSVFGEHKSFPFLVGQLVGCERKKLLGYYAAVRYQTVILGFYGTEFSIQHVQLHFYLQTLPLTSRATISSQSVSVSEAFSVALGGTNNAGFTQEFVMISMMDTMSETKWI